MVDRSCRASRSRRTMSPREKQPSVVYVLPRKMGGVFNYIDNILSHRKPDGMKHIVVLDDNALGTDHRPDERTSADEELTFGYSLPPENLRAVLKRLYRLIPEGPGALVANDWISLAMSTVHDTGRTVFSITHGDFDYYYRLAVSHEAVIDCFVTYTDRMRNRLVELMPHRADSILSIPYGVEIPDTARTPVDGPLRLLFVGRLEEGKGIFDLPKIDARLRATGVKVRWTIQGDGPDQARLQSAWEDQDDVTWRGRQPMSEVLRQYEAHDVLVMPSRYEGLPVALLEAAVRGVVPVVSDLPSGIPEVVHNGKTGFRTPVGDIDAMAEAIASIDANRDALERMSSAITALSRSRFDISERAVEYQQLFSRWSELRRPRSSTPRLGYGSRLDRPWIPNAIVRYLRKAK